MKFRQNIDVDDPKVSWGSKVKVTRYGSVQSTQATPLKSLKTAFFNLATLTFNLWPWPSGSSEILSRSILTPNFKVKFLSQSVWLLESLITDTHTHTHTHTNGTNFIPSTTEAGGNDHGLMKFPAYAFRPYLYDGMVLFWVLDLGNSHCCTNPPTIFGGFSVFFPPMKS